MVAFPLRKDNLIFREESFGGLVFNPETGEIFELQKTGALIYSLCDGKHTVDDICNVILERFEVKREDAHKDLMEFLRQLKDLRLIDYKQR